MGSPFPGMDPYIEVSHLWEDFHSKLIGEIERALSSRVPDGYFVRIGERSYVAAPQSEFRETFVEIHKADHELVTGIEIVSPLNKRAGTKGWDLYTWKRQLYLSGFANFIEIDLLRRGRCGPMFDMLPESRYSLLVSHKEQAPRCAIWPAYCTEPLPVIPVPLAPPDPDVVLDLQPLVAAIYERSRYDRDIDYRRPVDPPLSAAEAAWLTSQ
jgi:hypothetical protein